MKIPANAMQRKFIIGLLDENKRLSEQLKQKNQVALQQSIKITQLKHANEKLLTCFDDK